MSIQSGIDSLADNCNGNYCRCTVLINPSFLSISTSESYMYILEIVLTLSPCRAFSHHVRTALLVFPNNAIVLPVKSVFLGQQFLSWKRFNSCLLWDIYPSFLYNRSAISCNNVWSTMSALCNVWTTLNQKSLLSLFGGGYIYFRGAKFIIRVIACILAHTLDNRETAIEVDEWRVNPHLGLIHKVTFLGSFLDDFWSRKS